MTMARQFRKRFYYAARAFGPPEDLLTQLGNRRGVKGSEIDFVLFSHAHWYFFQIFFMFTEGSLSKFKKMFQMRIDILDQEQLNIVHLATPPIQNQHEMGYFFELKSKTENFSEFTGPWQKFGAFEKAYDFLGDGSLWVIQAPGRMPGNLIYCVLLKQENGLFLVIVVIVCMPISMPSI